MQKKKEKIKITQSNFIDSDQQQNFFTMTIHNSSIIKQQRTRCNSAYLKKKSFSISSSSSNQSKDWKNQFIKSIHQQKQSQTKQELQKINIQRKRKYPKQTKNFKKDWVHVIQKGKKNTKYEDLCPICLDQYSIIRANLRCGHKFCVDCLQEWVKTSTRCPCCRQSFIQYVKVTMNKKKMQIKRQIIEVEQKQMKYDELDYLICYSCGVGEDEDVLLICDICDFYCCHVYCDETLHNVFPQGNWFCKHCQQTMNKQDSAKKQNKQNKNQTKIHPENQIKSAQYFSSEDQSLPQENDSQDQKNSTRLTRSTSYLENNSNSRSKTFEIMNQTSNLTRKRFRIQMEKIVSNPTINLRNLRRKIK